MAGYRRLHMLVDQEDGSFWEETQKLVLDRVAHTPDLGHRNLVSAKIIDVDARRTNACLPGGPRYSNSIREQIADLQHAPQRKWMVCSTAPRCAVTRTKREKSIPVKYLSVARQSRRDITEFIAFSRIEARASSVGQPGYWECD